MGHEGSGPGMASGEVSIVVVKHARDSWHIPCRTAAQVPTTCQVRPVWPVPRYAQARDYMRTLATSAIPGAGLRT